MEVAYYSCTSDLHYYTSKQFPVTFKYSLLFPLSLLPPLSTLMEVVVEVCHCIDVGTLQAMLAEHTELDITLITEGGVTSSSEQVGGVTHTHTCECVCLQVHACMVCAYVCTCVYDSIHVCLSVYI